MNLIQLTWAEPLSVPRGLRCWMSYRLTLSSAHRPHPSDPWESAHFRLGILGSLKRSRGNRGLASCDCLAAAVHAELFWVSFPRVAEDDLGCGPSRRALQKERRGNTETNQSTRPGKGSWTAKPNRLLSAHSSPPLPLSLSPALCWGSESDTPKLQGGIFPRLT